MALYLGLEAATHGLHAVVIEIERDIRRVVFNRALSFDRDLPDYGTSDGVRHSDDGDLLPSPVMWADALDRMLGRLAAAAEIEIERLQAIAGAAHDFDGDHIHQYLPDGGTLDPAVPLATQLQRNSPIAKRFDSLASYLEALITGPGDRLSSYWQKRFALPPAAIVPWTGEAAASAIGSGVLREGVVAVSFGPADQVIACGDEGAVSATVTTFRNGSVARELLRAEHRLDWDAVDRVLERSPGNDGCVMLPWIELETTPRIAHAGARRFGFDRNDTARNMRGLIEGQVMAMANHVPIASGAAIERVIASGDAAARRAVLQVMANVFGVDVYRSDTAHPAALGAALRAFHADRLAAGEPVSWNTVIKGFAEPNPRSRVSPNSSDVALYAELRTHYALLERLHKNRAPIC